MFDHSQVKLSQQIFNSSSQAKTCRACLNVNCFTTFSFKSVVEFVSETGDINNLTMAEIFQMFTSIQVSDENYLIDSICESCTKHLLQCLVFKILCIKSDIALKELTTLETNKKLPANLTDLNASIDSNCEELFLQSFDIKKNTPNLEDFFEEQINTIYNELEKPIQNMKSHICSNCNNNYETEDELNKHECINLIIEMKNPDNKQNPINIESTNNNLKSFICSICGKKIKHKTTLKKHLIRHSNVKKFKCNKCDQKFFSKGELTKHSEKHTLHLKHICEICGSNFSRKDALVTHRKIHIGLKPHTCNYCAKSFLNPYNLQNHNNIHLNKQAYICFYCEKGFTQRTSLITHIKRLHMD